MWNTSPGTAPAPGPGLLPEFYGRYATYLKKKYIWGGEVGES